MDFFGQGAVAILARLGMDTLALGTEETDYQQIANPYTVGVDQDELFHGKLT